MRRGTTFRIAVLRIASIGLLRVFSFRAETAIASRRVEPRARARLCQFALIASPHRVASNARSRVHRPRIARASLVCTSAHLSYLYSAQSIFFRLPFFIVSRSICMNNIGHI